MESYMTEETLKRIMALEALADKRLVLLKRYNKEKKVCMFCHTRWHTDDCELAKELRDADAADAR